MRDPLGLRGPDPLTVFKAAEAPSLAMGIPLQIYTKTEGFGTELSPPAAQSHQDVVMCKINKETNGINLLVAVLYFHPIYNVFGGGGEKLLLSTNGQI